MQCTHNGTLTEKEVCAAVLEGTRELLDKGYITTKGAIFFGLLSLKDAGVEEVHPGEMIKILGISKSMFYRAKREIEEQEGWKLRARREIQLRTVTPPQD
jgi:hypothetical protein